ncbi:hypothetical protein T4A_8723 [Trichinella pseudospiralis]|uniref:Uncharacterized protein n=2 Tax=Trichinella pseudospiralis TaxID=6337 RepID=A0A0V1ERK8_TRIPS|nr:hypothetical protein T4A_8723 [Trichinella pseudospiralis]KRY86689.1 hypothetical protein T4D_16639 [Trichinella pseudospiralis]KRZ38935.1 hypothetical protein T4C_9633 [Trichinella pseudospiralis]
MKALSREDSLLSICIVKWLTAKNAFSKDIHDEDLEIILTLRRSSEISSSNGQVGYKMYPKEFLQLRCYF